jgi:membrane protein YdbS with pleckstrin-like domain
VIDRDKLGALTKIGRGVVYGAPNVKTKFAASMAYKEYKARSRFERFVCLVIALLAGVGLFIICVAGHRWVKAAFAAILVFAAVYELYKLATRGRGTSVPR